MDQLEDSIGIDAPPAAVWALVSDVRRMAEWSPQVTSTRIKDAAEPGEGVAFTNRNQHGELAWTTHARIVRFAPEEEIAFRVEENWAVWSFHLAPDGAGTRLTQRRATPDGISELSRELTEGFLGGMESFTASLRDGMRQTLVGIKATAEA
ncbi:SRPBCC family protein [Nocardioides daeguensis]|uniref:SRPBCC family protein n=1 Tax=Nocardioides daeguensis TaxID=908359 RepID=A0ABP6VGT0_9ACTN|nr:SRPBCC family protein [Nocardioides daeguensis]MBV6729486.1 SRPBCC family protein [Nocardioides daeguensis]MCR1771741.1 SRPBCC family protein [Nocardioides daeguensis]